MTSLLPHFFVLATEAQEQLQPSDQNHPEVLEQLQPSDPNHPEYGLKPEITLRGDAVRKLPRK